MDGMISLPLVNEVQAAGLTPLQLRDMLKSRLSEYLPNPEVSVIVMEMRGYTVSVLGEVKIAGRYQFTNPVTVLDVLARAGGITEFASPSQVFVLRPEKGAMKRIAFNYTKVISAPDEHQNFFIQPGDIVVVP
jgi:polysaccharide biosynthesis/export protein